MQKNWQIKDSNPQLQVALSDSLSIHPIVAQLLINRGLTDIKEAQAFLKADLSSLHNPFLLKNMDVAVQRIRRAQAAGERVLVVGDYDVDGVTSSVLLNNVFNQLGMKVFHYIPHRIYHGYGLNQEVVEFARQKEVRLLIAIDCGINAYQEVQLLHSAGVDTIIIDHHEPDGQLPAAVAIINPKQKDCPYPFKHLASVGLAVKLTQAILGKLNNDILDLAAIGTITDIVPLQGENRILVKSGLTQLANTTNQGLVALLETAKIKGKKITPFHVGFILGPRINAAGRMDTAMKSLDLFLSQDPKEVFNLAKALERHNTERQRMQRDITDEAMAIVEENINFNEQKVIVLSKQGWHKGVLGIVASKITEKYYRPTIIISVNEDGIGTASCRSIEGFHLYNALATCAQYLEKFGGHEGAAGLTIRQENIDPFRHLINKIAYDMLQAKKLIPTLHIDCEIPLSSVTTELADTVEAMGPFGEGNPAPTFCSRQVTVKTPAKILGRDTIKFWVTDGLVTISAIGFGLARHSGAIFSGAKIDLAYQITFDDWGKEPMPQLRLKDIHSN